MKDTHETGITVALEDCQANTIQSWVRLTGFRHIPFKSLLNYRLQMKVNFAFHL